MCSCLLLLLRLLLPLPGFGGLAGLAICLVFLPLLLHCKLMLGPLLLFSRLLFGILLLLLLQLVSSPLVFLARPLLLDTPPLLVLLLPLQLPTSLLHPLRLHLRLPPLLALILEFHQLQRPLGTLTHSMVLPKAIVERLEMLGRLLGGLVVERALQSALLARVHAAVVLEHLQRWAAIETVAEGTVEAIHAA